MVTTLSRRFAASLAALLVSLALGHAVAAGPQAPSAGIPASATPSLEARVDEIFSRWTATTPGCAVGVSRDGRVVLEKGYGMADLEHDVPITAQTIFEAGSVSKQFTAAAVLLLARDGKISLDDRVQDFIPELRRLGTPLTIRQMLTHTSGLRDWGTLEAIAGWPRTTRVYTHEHVLDIVSRQRALNFAPGTNWSYSNTGYNLAAVVVARRAGEPFAQFCRRSLFEPLGLTHTSWRDDHTRIVKGRAIAYSFAKDGYHTEMPFENVHGNGGLLTTVGDLLRWNEHYESPGVGDAAIVRQQQEPARLASGQVLDYALGLYVRRYSGFLEVGHSGSTAGYRAYLARYPERHVSVAVLCNAANATAERYAHAVADAYLGITPSLQPAVQASAAASTATQPGGTAATDVLPAALASRVGMYRHSVRGEALVLVQDKGMLRIEGGPALVAASGSRLELPNAGGAIEFVGNRLSRRLPNGLVEWYERVTPVKPGIAALRAFEGVYASDEAEVELTVCWRDGLRLERRPGTTISLKPLYADAFGAQGLGTVLFRRKAGKVVEMSVVADRVWDMRFHRVRERAAR